MRGHERLIAMRKSGLVPKWVWIDTDPDCLESWREWSELDPKHAHIQIESGDKRPDFRCVVGLACYVLGSIRARVFEMRDDCIKAGAGRVIASVVQRHGEGEFSAFRMLECTDTAGKVGMSPELCEATE